MTERLSALSDTDALSVLRLVVYRLDLGADMETLRRVQGDLTTALDDATWPDVEPDVAASPGELARATLAYLATDPQSRDAVAWAASNAVEPSEREPLSMVVGALVVLALRSEILIERDPKKGLTVRFHLKPSAGPILRTVFGQLVGLFGSNPPSSTVSDSMGPPPP